MAERAPALFPLAVILLCSFFQTLSLSPPSSLMISILFFRFFGPPGPFSPSLTSYSSCCGHPRFPLFTSPFMDTRYYALLSCSSLWSPVILPSFMVRLTDVIYDAPRSMGVFPVCADPLFRRWSSAIFPPAPPLSGLLLRRFPLLRRPLFLSYFPPGAAVSSSCQRFTQRF